MTFVLAVEADPRTDRRVMRSLVVRATARSASIPPSMKACCHFGHDSAGDRAADPHLDEVVGDSLRGA